MAAIIRKLNKSQCMILKNILKNNNGLSRMVMSTQVDVKGQAVNAKLDGKPKLTSEKIFDREDKYGAHNYHPLPVALCKGQGKVYLFNYFYNFNL